MQFIDALFKREPARVCAVLAAVVVFVAAKAGIVVKQQDVVRALLIVLPILLAGEGTRRAVLPVHAIVHDYSKLPPDPVNLPPTEAKP